MKYLRNIDWGPFVAAGLFLVFVFAVLSPSPHKRLPSQNVKQNSTTSSWWDTFWDIRASDSLVAAFTGALVVVGWIQAKRLREAIDSQKIDMGNYVEEAKRSAAAMEEVADGIGTQAENMKKLMADQTVFWKSQMRAYVFLESGFIVNVADPPSGYVKSPNAPIDGHLFARDRGPMVTVRIKNSGHTPAHDVVHIMMVVVREFPLAAYPLPTLVPSNSEYMTKFDLPPLNGLSTQNYTYWRALTPDQISGLQNASLAVYISGRIEYTDAFGEHHLTTYRYRHNALTGAIGISTDVTGTSHGNYSD